MPYTEFKALPDKSKAWIFAANRPLTADEREIIDTEVPNFLSQWTAHGAPVPASHEIRDDQFLVIAADESVAPGGCSIDSLFRFVRALGEHLEIDMLSSGKIWYRDKAGEIRGIERPGSVKPRRQKRSAKTARSSTPLSTISPPTDRLSNGPPATPGPLRCSDLPTAERSFDRSSVRPAPEPGEGSP